MKPSLITTDAESLSEVKACATEIRQSDMPIEDKVNALCSMIWTLAEQLRQTNGSLEYLTAELN